MFKNKRILAIIPARGGSKGIPGKNIKNIGGKPLIRWTTDFALSIDFFDKVLVTTDSQEIGDISKLGGAEVPFLRPPELALDDTPTLPVLAHAISWLKNNEEIFDYVFLLEPTSPVRFRDDINKIIEILESEGVDSVVSVSPVPKQYCYAWQLRIDENLLTTLEGKSLDNLIPNRQALTQSYFRNGYVYAFKSKLLLQGSPSIYGERSYPYIMDSNKIFDINNMSDWELVEKYLQSN